MFYLRNGAVFLLALIFHFINHSAGFHISEELYERSNRTIRQAAKCTGRNYNCKSGECISNHMVCDGTKDCKDGSDETTLCRDLIKECPGFSFRCAYGACVDGDSECSGSEECADGSDENTARCSKTIISKACGKRKFTCNDGDCIDSYSLCDGIVNCADGSDETYASCSRIRCPRFAYQCAYGACVDGLAKCNGIVECADSSDENPDLCGKPSGSTTLSPEVSTSTVGPPIVVGCVLPPQPTDGKYTVSGNVNLQPGSTVPDGTYLIFSCNTNYDLNPNVTIIICAQQIWSAVAFPSCIKTCPSRVSESVDIKCEFEGREVDCSKRVYEGTIATMQCKYHYEPADTSFRNNLIQCKDGSWDFDLLRCIPGCGKLIPKTGQLFVVGGTAAGVGDFPWHVGIYRKRASNTTVIDHICGGSIINAKVIISAAHCFTDEITGIKKPIEQYLVAAGKYYREYNDARDQYAQQSNVANIVISSEYRALKSSYTHDIALVILKQTLAISNLIQPVCIDWLNVWEEEQLTATSFGRVVGWGLTQEGGKSGSIDLKQLTVPFVDKDTCFQVVPPDFTTYITSDKICAGWTNGSSVCQGDSGGGLVFLKKDSGRFYLRGLVSNGPIKGDSCDSRQVGLYTQVSKHLDLIRRTELYNRPS